MPYSKPQLWLVYIVKHKIGMYAQEWGWLLFSMLEISGEEQGNIPMSLWCLLLLNVKR